MAPRTGALRIGGPRAGAAVLRGHQAYRLECRGSAEGHCCRRCHLRDGGGARPPCWIREWRSGPRSRAELRPYVILRPEVRQRAWGERLRAPRGGARAADCVTHRSRSIVGAAHGSAHRFCMPTYRSASSAFIPLSPMDCAAQGNGDFARHGPGAPLTTE
ncbi:hypothetical protein NDU88_007314 [Pleurodeles waltl]|uniref:Uncharacterized protein n=1 Tax=Pleurodeles waltl TaxID=8319 RepID=A0AAV7QND7_PLEWA|nr:hypothetical protein NDU88_007314 [Pleurodeles waltl]